jgi:hypothetical protein
MKLLTKEIMQKLPPLYSTDGKGPVEKRAVIVKFFYPAGAATWYAIEGSKQDDGDWLFFGYIDLGMGPECSELGYFSLRELSSFRGKFGLGIERDMHFGIQPLGKFMQ